MEDIHYQRAQKAWIKLLELAGSRKTCNSKEIGDYIGIHRRVVRHALNPIQKYCLNNNLPPLTILVVNSITGMPGEGFRAVKKEEIPKKMNEVFEYNWKEIKNPFDYHTFEQIETEFQEKVIQAGKLSNEKLQEILSKSNHKATTTTTIQTVFNRNPYVVVAVLRRADGICEKCNKPAPFIKDKDNTPYLEVHHIIPLVDKGEDKVENAIALCPNCHRHVHHGKSSYF